MKKYLIGAVILIIIIFLFSSLKYKILPTKKVDSGVSSVISGVEKEFVINSGQTVEFGNDKYVTHCGYSGNGMTTDFYPMFSWEIKGSKYPCSESSFGYTSFDEAPCNSWGLPCGPYRPYDMEYDFTGDKKPLKVKIFETRDLYNKWTYDSCSWNSQSASDQIKCIKDNPNGLHNPNDCRMQKIVSEGECIDDYVKSFKTECKVRPETHNIGSGTGTIGIENQDDCVKDKIVVGHLPSENCTLVIEDRVKMKECLDNRLKEENLFKELYAD
jgi:hypothetical protein